MINDFVCNKTRPSWATCMSTFHSHGHVHVQRYVPSLSTFVTQYMSCLLIPFPCKMCDGQSHVFVLIYIKVNYVIISIFITFIILDEIGSYTRS